MPWLTAMTGRMPTSVALTDALESVAAASPTVTPRKATDELRLLRNHNESLIKQLALKDQALERLRQKVQEKALMMSHEKAADVQHARREAGDAIGAVEAENARLRDDLAHRTTQLHSAVTRIGALKDRIEDLELVIMDQEAERARRERKAAARRRKAGVGKRLSQKQAMAALLGTQDSMLAMIEDLSAVAPTTGGGGAAAEADDEGYASAGSASRQPPAAYPPTYRHLPGRAERVGKAQAREAEVRAAWEKTSAEKEADAMARRHLGHPAGHFTDPEPADAAEVAAPADAELAAAELAAWTRRAPRSGAASAGTLLVRTPRGGGGARRDAPRPTPRTAAPAARPKVDAKARRAARAVAHRAILADDHHALPGGSTRPHRVVSSARRVEGVHRLLHEYDAKFGQAGWHSDGAASA